MVILQFILVIVAIQAIEHGIIIRRGMAFIAVVPLTLMLPAVNREIHIVVVKSGRLPSILVVASSAVRREIR